MNSELKNIQQFFTERRLRCLSVKSLEIEAKLPAKTLNHFLKGRRLLNSEHLDTLIPVLVDFGYKPVVSCRFYRGYTIRNHGYYPPDKCVWWEAVNDETGEADFHAKRLRDIISMINEALGVQNGA